VSSAQEGHISFGALNDDVTICGVDGVAVEQASYRYVEPLGADQ
jgi:hypothetical protein